MRESIHTPGVPMGVSLGIQALHFRGEQWWQTDTLVELLDAVVAQSGLSSSALWWKHEAVDGGRRTTLDTLRQDLPRLRPPGALEVGGDDGLSVTLSLRPGFTDAHVRIEDPLLAARADSVISWMIDLCERLVTLKHVRTMGPFARVFAAGIKYPMPHPPPSSRWPMDVLALILSEAYVTREAPAREEAARDDFELLASSPLPPRGHRERRGDLLVLRWTETLTDLPTAMSDAHAWMGEVVAHGRLMGGYNELGDRLYSNLLPTLPAHPPFERYKRERGLGYLALDPADLSPLQDVRRWLAAGALPDGSPVKLVRAITDTREGCLAVREATLAAGIPDVFYRHAFHPDKHIWNPWPPGPWRSTP